MKEAPLVIARNYRSGLKFLFCRGRLECDAVHFCSLLYNYEGNADAFSAN